MGLEEGMSVLEQGLGRNSESVKLEQKSKAQPYGPLMNWIEGAIGGNTVYPVGLYSPYFPDMGSSAATARR